MRAKDFPKALFCEINRRFNNLPVSNITLGKDVWEIFRFEDRLIFAVHMYEDGQNRIYSRMEVWRHFDQAAEEKPEEIISVWGGPRQNGHWARGSGHSLDEEVFVRVGTGVNFHGVRPNTAEWWAFTIVMNVCNQLLESTSIDKRRYWEAYHDPDYEYRKP